MYIAFLQENYLFMSNRRKPQEVRSNVFQLFPSIRFIAPFSQDDFPVEFTIRERVYFETRVDSEDSTLSILALNCYATPYQDRNSQPKYDIIKDG